MGNHTGPTNTDGLVAAATTVALASVAGSQRLLMWLSVDLVSSELKLCLREAEDIRLRTGYRENAHGSQLVRHFVRACRGGTVTAHDLV